MMELWVVALEPASHLPSMHPGRGHRAVGERGKTAVFRVLVPGRLPASPIVTLVSRDGASHVASQGDLELEETRHIVEDIVSSSSSP